MKKIIYIIVILTVLVNACQPPKKKEIVNQLPHQNFDFGVFDTAGVAHKLVRGQIVYLPVYSNIPYHIDSSKFDMNAFVAIHNLDLQQKIKLKKVMYFDTDGKLVFDFLKGKDLVINPIATKDFYVPYEDKSGTGANFLIEWEADTLVCEPLIESVTYNLRNNQSAAVLSAGKVIKEKK